MSGRQGQAGRGFRFLSIRIRKFHESALREGGRVDKGNAVSFELGTDRKTGRVKATRVDLV
jgi:hypothetical protein